jgi:hypothetical protein
MSEYVSTTSACGTVTVRTYPLTIRELSSRMVKPSPPKKDNELKRTQLFVALCRERVSSAVDKALVETAIDAWGPGIVEDVD